MTLTQLSIHRVTISDHLLHTLLPMSKLTLTKEFGLGALDDLVQEIQSFPNLYGRTCTAWTRLEALEPQVRNDLNEVVMKMNLVHERADSKVTEDLIWRSWRSLRHRFITQINKGSTIKKWDEHLAFLLPFTEEGGQRRNIPRGQSLPAVHFAAIPAHPAPNVAQKTRPLSILLGPQFIRDLVEEVRKYPALRERRIAKAAIPPEARDSWTKVIGALYSNNRQYNEELPDDLFERAWKSWRQLRLTHGTKDAPKRWRPILGWLNEAAPPTLMLEPSTSRVLRPRQLNAGIPLYRFQLPPLFPASALHVPYQQAVAPHSFNSRTARLMSLPPSLPTPEEVHFTLYNLYSSAMYSFHADPSNGGA